MSTSSLKLSVNGQKYLVTGITRGTSCKDLLCALAKVTAQDRASSDDNLVKGYTSISASRLEKITADKSHRSHGDLRNHRKASKEKDKGEETLKKIKSEISKREKSYDTVKKDKNEKSNKKSKKSKSKDSKENKENKVKKSKVKVQKTKVRNCSVDDSEIDGYKHSHRMFTKRTKRRAYDDSDIETYQSLLSLVDSQSRQIKTQVKDMKISKTEWVQELRKKSPSYAIGIIENRPKLRSTILCDLKDDADNDNDSGLPSLDYDSSREPSLKEDDILGRHDSGIGSETTHASPVIVKRSEHIVNSGCDKRGLISNSNNNDALAINNNCYSSANDRNCEECSRENHKKLSASFVSSGDRNCEDCTAKNNTNSSKNEIETVLVHRSQVNESLQANDKLCSCSYRLSDTTDLTARTETLSNHDKPNLNCAWSLGKTEDMLKTKNISSELMDKKVTGNNDNNDSDDNTDNSLADTQTERNTLWTEYSKACKELTETADELLYKDLIQFQVEFELKCLEDENSEFEDQILADEEELLLEELIGTQDLLDTVVLLTKCQEHDAENNFRELRFLESEVKDRRLQIDSLEKVVWRTRYKTAPRSLIKRCRTNPNMKGLISDDFDDDVGESSFV